MRDGAQGGLALKILVTGAAGFIGFHACRALLARRHEVVGVDSLDPYYSVGLKKHRLSLLRQDGFDFQKLDLTNGDAFRRLWRREKPDRVLHLAAQAGVAHSLKEPMAYIRSNVVAFQNVIEAVRDFDCENFVYASSSSVYGGSEGGRRLAEDDPVKPANLYAATKLGNEQVARAYGELFRLPSTALRFFTVYGEFGRPDMAMWRFARAMLRSEPVMLYNRGDMTREFTHVDDAVAGALGALLGPSRIGAVYNLAGGQAVGVPYVVEQLERELRLKAELRPAPHRLGDVVATSGCCLAAARDLNYAARVPIDQGIARFARWYENEGVRFG